MAKKETNENAPQRTSRKEYLRARRQEEQQRQARLVAAGIAGIIGVILLVMFVAEFLIAPNQAVAVVDGEDIALNDWQDQVRYRRASLVILLENQLEAFTGGQIEGFGSSEAEAIGLIQQFLGNQINQIAGDPTILGEEVLEAMIQEELIRQEAERRGITVTEADIDEYIAENFNYFGGESPTPFPTASPTVMPTPSLTPIGFELPPTAAAPTATPAATATPGPTATAVSQESFQESFNEELADYEAYGISEATYRAAIEAQLYRDKLREALAEEAELADEARHYNFYFISTQSDALAQSLADRVAQDGYLQVWNEIRTNPQSILPEGSTDTPPVASEVLRRTADDLETVYPDVVVEAVTGGAVGQPSDLIVEEADVDMETGEASEPSTYYIIQVSGSEVLPLAANTLDSQAGEILREWLQEQQSKVQRTEFWRSRTPTQPMLDPKFLQPPPTQPAAPALPTVPITQPDDGGTGDGADGDAGGDAGDGN
ncbi:MAG TPA: SurA N-terminal domain-containing protein [Anaerolineae bacterium]|nr:SurA N-terminal domain-containing protein [Anaerolineae bacterium]